MFSERQKLEEEKLALKFKEEQFDIDTEIEICNAKVQAFDEFEKTECMEEPLKPKTKTPQVVMNFEPQSDTSKCNTNSELNVLAVAKELNKPKVDIQPFKGNPIEYTRFVRQFNSRICNNTDSFEERMNYLLQYTEGEAHKIALGYSNLDSKRGYEATWHEFKDRTGTETQSVLLEHM